MAATPFDAAGARISVFRALLQAVSRHGKSRIALEDPERQPITYGRLVLGALVGVFAFGEATTKWNRAGLALAVSACLWAVVWLAMR